MTVDKLEKSVKNLREAIGPLRNIANFDDKIKFAPTATDILTIIQRLNREIEILGGTPG